MTIITLHPFSQMQNRIHDSFRGEIFQQSAQISANPDNIDLLAEQEIILGKFLKFYTKFKVKWVLKKMKKK